MQAIPLVLSAGGTLLKGVSSFQAGKFDRKVANVNARQALVEGNEQGNRIRAAARIRLGQQFGAQAESGFMVNQGSALDSLVESATNSELEAMDALNAARSRAAAYHAQGQAAYAEGKGALVGSLFGAASSAVQGYNDYANAGSQYGGGGGS